MKSPMHAAPQSPRRAGQNQSPVHQEGNSKSPPGIRISSHLSDPKKPRVLLPDTRQGLALILLTPIHLLSPGGKPECP